MKNNFAVSQNVMLICDFDVFSVSCVFIKSKKGASKGYIYVCVRVCVYAKKKKSPKLHDKIVN